MSNLKHTPGPWKLDSGTTNFLDTGDHMNYDIVIGNQLPIAMVSEHFNDEQTKANAKLIASAPELLEALKDALNDIKSHIKNTCSILGYDDVKAFEIYSNNTTVIKIELVIKKATE